MKVETGRIKSATEPSVSYVQRITDNGKFEHIKETATTTGELVSGLNQTTELITIIREITPVTTY